MSKSGLLALEDEVQSKLHAVFGLKDIHPLLVVGVSGGPDSMALLYLLHKIGVEALVVHINYGKRGEDADKDAELVEEIAYEWGFECHSVKVDSTDAEGQNFQQWARSVRYTIFRDLLDEYDADGIALAHHRDDQIETVLQKMFRGSGLESWSAMQVWDGELFRPLLATSKEEIKAYCEKRAVPYRLDESNRESDFARNFLRNEWTGELGVHFPGWEKNILRLPERAETFLEAMNWISKRLTDEKDRINRKQLLELEESLSKSLILHKLKIIEPGVSVSTDALEELSKLPDLQTGKRIQLTDSYSILRDRDCFKIVYEEQESLTVVELLQDELTAKSFSLDGIEIEIKGEEKPDFEVELHLDAGKLSWPLTLRRWKNGDSFQPFGMEGHQNVSDHLTNRKISSEHKNRALVLETFDETICAVIFPPIENRVPPGTISELSRCEDSTKRRLIIKRT